MSQAELPKKGTPKSELFAKMDEARGTDTNWKAARLFGFVYRTDDDVHEVGKEAYAKFITENGLSPFAFPSLLKFETDVVSMTAKMLHGGEDAVGNLTSGGSESLLMAVKAAREWSRATKPEIKEPEMVVVNTVHPGWDKAAHYLGLKIVHVPVAADFRSDVAAMRAACTANTVMLVCSAPTYPHGVVDRIDELGKLAQEKNLWLHVDACLGGFVLPFAEKLGYDIPLWDFRVPGVTSISADVHKYGYAPKGASTILYRNDTYRLYQYFAYAEWAGGVYGTPTMLGARPGGAYAGAWAVMNYLGEEGYLRLVRKMMDATKKFQAAVKAIPELKIIGDPHASIFAIGSDVINIYALGDAMKKRNWHMEGQQFPPALHVTMSPGHADVIDEVIKDLNEAMVEARGAGEAALSESAAMYGMMSSLPDRSMAKELALQYLNGIYK